MSISKLVKNNFNNLLFTVGVYVCLSSTPAFGAEAYVIEVKSRTGAEGFRIVNNKGNESETFWYHNGFSYHIGDINKDGKKDVILQQNGEPIKNFYGS